eukprot:scaffold72574_cov41-Attheya_sp.AAC.1
MAKKCFDTQTNTQQGQLHYEATQNPHGHSKQGIVCPMKGRILVIVTCGRPRKLLRISLVTK